MLSFTSSNIIAMSIIVYLCLVAPSASGKTGRGTAGVSRYRADTSQTKPAHDNRHGRPSKSTAVTSPAVRRIRDQSRSSRRDTPLPKYVRTAKTNANKTRSRTPTSTKRRRQDEEPTPEPTGPSSTSTTVYANDANTFALLMPHSGEMVSDAEQDGVAYCTDGSGCGNDFPDGLITGAAYSAAEDGSYVQITGCLDSSKFPFAEGDDGGQFDVRFPNGAQCTFGGYGASFIEVLEPSANRFCLRCCQSPNDQVNCNSHQDRAGCPTAIPGTYDFGDVSCS